MNLNALANTFTQAVTENVIGTARLNDGTYETAPDGTQTPGYTEVTGVSMQFQALDGDDLEQIDGINRQGVMQAVYVDRRVSGVIDAAGKGGDMLIAPTGFSGGANDTWLVTKVLETWVAGGWTKAAVTLQK